MKEKTLKDGRKAFLKDGKWLVPISKEKKSFLDLLRDAGKIMNFSALYGSGAKGLATFLQKEFPNKSFSDLMKTAHRAIRAKKGVKNRRTGNFSGGTDSAAFNKMAEISLKTKVPSLPCLGTKITTALRPDAVGNDFIPGRMNWAIQASGAEILSVTLVAMHWLCREHGVPVMFVVSIHDEIWWLVPEEYGELAAGLFQMTHLYVWGLFNHQLGMSDLALNNAFFSGVAVDRRVRKSVNESTVTPSNPDGDKEPPGKEYTVGDLDNAGVFKRLSERLAKFGSHR